MTRIGFLWMCYQNWSILSILKILHINNKVQKKSGIFLKKNWSEKSDWVFVLPSQGGGRSD
jgi:hypothetical protein